MHTARADQFVGTSRLSSSNQFKVTTRITYMFEGKQYLVVAVGDVNRPAEYVALGLP